MILLFYLALWLGLCAVVGAWHHGRGYDFAGPFFLSVFFSPLAGVIFVLWDAPDLEELEERQIRAGRRRRCPACKEAIWDAARICPHCRVQLRVDGA